MIRVTITTENVDCENPDSPDFNPDVWAGIYPIVGVELPPDVEKFIAPHRAALIALYECDDFSFDYDTTKNRVELFFPGRTIVK